MKTGLEEALADCLALMERGGSIEDCLARYPRLARELEPLLLTSLGLQQAYDVRPRPSFQHAALQRFLVAAARGGRQPRAMAPPPRRFGWGWRWAPVAVSAPLLAVAVALAAVLALTGGGGDGPEGRVIVRRVIPPPTEAPTQVVKQDIPQLLVRAQERLGAMQEQVAQGVQIPREAIQELRDINQSLEQTLSESPPGAVEAAPQIADLLKEQEEVINSAREQDQVAPEAAEDVDDLISIATAMQTRIDEMLSPTPTPTPEPTLTPTPEPTQTPTPTPTPAPTETPGASPTPTGTPAASPTTVPTTVSSPTPGPATAAGASPTPASPPSAPPPRP